MHDLQHCELKREEKLKVLIMGRENEGREADCIVAFLNAYLNLLKDQNDRFRADKEASELSALVDDEKRAEVVKKEKNCRSKITAVGNQVKKLKEELEDKKKQCLALHEELVSLEKAQKEFEEVVQAKELAMTQLQKQKELKLKEEAEANLKCMQEAVRAAQQKMATDSQLHKDEIQRLMEEVSRIQMSSELADPHNPQDVMVPGQLEHYYLEDELYICLCLRCMNKASELFLPCRHQILCSSRVDPAEACCPCCQAPITSVYDAADRLAHEKASPFS